ncbi:Uncharacterised protein [Vibrio cholerae]|nr:Uncharacterised protein [Vibrio cholerae]CSI34134.1 Uncharacterised protein [Vibrio cholerae]
MAIVVSLGIAKGISHTDWYAWFRHCRLCVSCWAERCLSCSVRLASSGVNNACSVCWLNNRAAAACITILVLLPS